jgi:chemotaxis methyl-accepting protein methylase
MRRLIKSLIDPANALWRGLPRGWVAKFPLRTIGTGINALSRRFSHRGQTQGTWFLRNEPLILVIRDLVDANFKLGDRVRLCSMGCSTGAEIYSVLWAIRKARPDLRIDAIGTDICESALAKARAGCYSRNDPEIVGPYCPPEPAVLAEDTIHELFDDHGDQLKTKAWIAEGVRWVVADLRDARAIAALGPQDIVLANNFLVHMKPPQAAACLSILAEAVNPGGLFVCRGVDLDLKKLFLGLQLTPVALRIEEIHNAAPFLDTPRHWPWKYCGLEPLDKSRADWVQRYAAVFRKSPSLAASPPRRQPAALSQRGREPAALSQR